MDTNKKQLLNMPKVYACEPIDVIKGIYLLRDITDRIYPDWKWGNAIVGKI